MRIWIPGEFATCNQYTGEERAFKLKAAEIKATETGRARFETMNRYEPITEYPVQIEFIWFRKDIKTDPDNIAFAQKFVLDGLVLAGILEGDTWDHIQSLHHEFIVDAEDPGVGIWIRPAKPILPAHPDQDLYKRSGK